MRLSEEEIAQFNRDGYLLVRGALEDADLDPVIAEYERHIDRRASELLAAGKISQTYADEPFDRRLASICSENNEIYRELDIMHFRGRACFEFLANDNLLDLVEGLVGPEITCSPIQHTRPKLPAGLTPGGSGRTLGSMAAVIVLRSRCERHSLVSASSHAFLCGDSLMSPK